MASRAERYYDKNINSSKRIVKNVDLYNTIYEDETYSNIEGIVETPKTNEIDIRKIKDLLIKQEREYKSRNQLVKKGLDIPDMADLDSYEDKNYDIRDILAQAKEEKETVEAKPRSLKNIDFEEIKRELCSVEKYNDSDTEKNISELRELINTFAGNNKDLNKLADNELSLDMFSDLAASTKELSNDDSNSIKKIIEEAKKIECKKLLDEQEEIENLNNIDKSFYTSTLNLKRKDFEEEEDEEENNNNSFSKIIKIILFVILAIILVVVGYMFLK